MFVYVCVWVNWDCFCDDRIFSDGYVCLFVNVIQYDDRLIVCIEWCIVFIRYVCAEKNGICAHWSRKMTNMDFSWIYDTLIHVAKNVSLLWQRFASACCFVWLFENIRKKKMGMKCDWIADWMKILLLSLAM